MTVPATVRAYLEGRGVSYDLVPHPRTYSSRETADAAHVAQDHIAKAVIVKDQERFVMAVIPGSHWLKRHALDTALDRALEIAGEDELAALFPDCQAGAIPAVGQAYGLETVVDESLTSLANVYFEAGDHQHLIHLAGDQFLALTAGLRRGYFSHPS